MVDPTTTMRAAIERFVKLTQEEWDMLHPCLAEKEYKKGELFAKEGVRAHQVGFLLEGNMRHFYTKDGTEQKTYFYFEGHFVSSYISCITGKPSELTIEALSDCKLLIFIYSEMKKLFEVSHTWERFGRLIAEYLAIGLEERMTDLLLLSPEERYIKLLEGGKQKIIERIPQQYISGYLGITPVSLSRIRQRLLKK